MGGVFSQVHAPGQAKMFCEDVRETEKRSFSLHARVISTAFLWRVFPLKFEKEI